MAPPPGAVPPTLAPSIEEAYRRKCIQLKQRMNEVEEANDASRVRLSRAQRAIEKLRLERAFLLEQLAKRTSTNVEDSEGSPSPPSTPKEKPLRTKRGHRKPSFLNTLGEGTGNAIIQGPATHSPSSDAFSHTQADSNPLHAPRALAADGRRQPQSNGHLPDVTQQLAWVPKEPRNVFDLYCNATRDIILANNRAAIAAGSFDIEQALAVGFRSLTDDQKSKYEQDFAEHKKARESRGPAAVNAENQHREADIVTERSRSAERRDTWTTENPQADDDVEMGEEAEEPPAEDAAGFTAVNRA